VVGNNINEIKIMQKTKFKIQGIKCDNCLLLIEEKLKSKDGVVKVKVDQISNKGVVIYDKQKIDESDIYKTIEEIGGFKVEKIEDGIKNTEDNANYDNPSGSREIKSPIEKTSNNRGVYAVIAVFAIIFLLVNFIPKADTGTQISGSVQNNQQQVQQQDQPAKQAGLQTFSITKDDHIRGNINATVTLVEFSDFECPFCERIYPTMNQILKDYKDKVRLVYKHFPLGFHPNAQKAAEASECASDQGKFWEYHDKIFENQPSGLSLEKFKQWAKDLGLNSGKFNDCLDSGKYAQKIQTDFQEGSQKGVNGTPATFINGQLVSGALPYDSFKQIIDNLLK